MQRGPVLCCGCWWAPCCAARCPRWVGGCGIRSVGGWGRATQVGLALWREAELAAACSAAARAGPSPSQPPSTAPAPQVIVTYGSRVLQLGPTGDPYGQVGVLGGAAGRAGPVRGCSQACVPAAAAGASACARADCLASPSEPAARPPPQPPTLTPKPPAPQKYKGIWVCLAILTRALGGSYVNFGVFDLYGDPALKVGGISFSCLEPHLVVVSAWRRRAQGGRVLQAGRGAPPSRTRRRRQRHRGRSSRSGERRGGALVVTQPPTCLHLI